MVLAPGDIAPDFTLPDADERPVSLMTYRGERVVLYFYPAALTPGCTTQACDFRDNLAAFRDCGLAVLGISPDPPAKLREFREKYALSFPLLADPSRHVLEAYGAWGEKKLYGKTVTGVIRSTIVVDPRGDVEQAFYNVKATGHVAKLLRDLRLNA
jgi:thioredoxin-dependent peroxiredoxin